MMIKISPRFGSILCNKINADQHQAQRIVIEFSSPNIAKPFHFGHLKSTILGNYLANLNNFFGNHVTKLNYLGDWGTQFGLLSLGLEEWGGLDKLPEPALKYLVDIYVKANKRAQLDDTFYSEARRRFISLEKGQDADLEDRWRRVRDLSIDELKSAYKLLGVEFDAFEFESNYAQKSLDLIELMESKKLVNKMDNGVLFTEIEKNNKPIKVPLLKSDGASLYISRDVAAAISRKEQYNFDKLLYIVGSDQEKHFHSLREIVKRLGYPWADNLIHLKMGKVLGMSTRSGNFVLLSDIIDEATRRYSEITRTVPTSKASNQADVERIGKQLALSALFVYDLRNPRTKSYEFNWDQVMTVGERSGVHLQTTYARLCSLTRKAASSRGLAPFESAEQLCPDAIGCADGMNLVSVLNELEVALHSSYSLMDASYLVNHGLRLCRAANRARKSNWLQVVREADERKARSRLSLFDESRRQLEWIIKMIGLQPLDRV